MASETLSEEFITQKILQEGNARSAMNTSYYISPGISWKNI